ncbi:MAG: hypothetical protein AAFQ62_14335 [Pseudomonadota bacterium]
MNRLNKVRVLMLALVMGLAGVAQAQSAAEANAWMAELEQTEVRDITEGEMKRLLGAMEEIEAMEGTINTDSPTMFDAIQANAEASSVLSRYDFDGQEFKVVVHNVMLAMGALAMRDQKAELDMAVQQLQAMKGQLPEAQYQALERQVLGAIQLFDRAPASNIALVEKYKEEIDAIGE